MPLKVFDERGRHVGSIQTKEEMLEEQKKKSEAETNAIVALIVGVVAVVGLLFALVVGFLGAPALVLYLFGIEPTSLASILSIAAWWIFLLSMVARRRKGRPSQEE